MIAACSAALFAASCSGSADVADEQSSTETETTVTAVDGLGIRVVPADEALSIQNSGSSDLVVLDVRTPDEFADGHLEGAVMLDFYDPEFAAQLAELDPDVPYLLYCQSGNRSGQTAAMMEQLGFADVADVDGGILAWAEAGQPITTD